MQRPIAEEALFAQYYAPFEINVNLRNGNDQTLLSNLSEQYINKNYTSAQSLLQDYLSRHPEAHDLQLALAICQLENDQITSARRTLQELAAKKDALLNDHVLWYTALIDMKEGHTDRARAGLQTLASNPEADHHTQAKALLAQLD